MDTYGETYRKNHSFSLAVVVGGVLLVETALAYMLTGVSSSGDAYGDGGYSVSLGDISKVLTLVDRTQIGDLAKIGVVVAIIAAVVVPRGYESAQKWVISLASAAALFLPIYVYRKLGDNEHVGAGLVIFALAAVIAIIAPWAVRDEDTPLIRHPSMNRRRRVSPANSR